MKRTTAWWSGDGVRAAHHEKVCGLAKMEEARLLGMLGLCSGIVVGANYREARQSRSSAESIAKIGDYLKELDEIGC